MFESEIAFLNRKTPMHTISWEIRTAISKLMSHLMPREEAERLHKCLAEMLSPRAKEKFAELAFIVDSQTHGSSRVVICINRLREFFSVDIDGWGEGGGGRG